MSGGRSGGGVGGPVTDEELERALEGLAGLPTRELLEDADARARLGTHLHSPDPLISYRAASLLVQASRCPSDWPADEAWVRQILVVDSDVATPRGLTNFLEACRRLVASVTADTEEVEEIGGRRSGLLIAVADAVPALQR